MNFESQHFLIDETFFYTYKIQLELDSMQQKYGTLKKEVEKLSPLRDEVARLQKELVCERLVQDGIYGK